MYQRINRQFFFVLYIRCQVPPPAFSRCGRSAPACPARTTMCVCFVVALPLGAPSTAFWTSRGHWCLSFPSFLSRVWFAHLAFPLLVDVHRFSANTSTLNNMPTYAILSARQGARRSAPPPLTTSISRSSTLQSPCILRTPQRCY